MRFRHLIEVPYIDHGSELAECSVDSNGAGSKAILTPQAQLNRMTFSLLKPGFELFPMVHLAWDPATFSFDEQNNAVTHSRFPTPADLFDKYRDPSALDSFLLRHYETVSEIYDQLGKAHSRELQVKDDPLPRAEALRNAIRRAVPYLMLSVVLDEFVFDRVQEHIWYLEKQARVSLRWLVFRSEFTRRLAAYPPELLSLRRLHIPLHQAYLAVRSENRLGTGETERQSFAKTAVTLLAQSSRPHLYEDLDTSLLWLGRIMYELSEEIFGLWPSVVSTLSVLITAWAEAEGVREASDLLSHDFDDLELYARKRRVI